MYEYFRQLSGFWKRVLSAINKHKVIHYEHPTLVGKPCMISKSFIPQMDRFCGYLEKCGLLFHVTHSFRTVDAIIIGAIVDPSKLSNHYIARGLDGNFIVGSEFYNSTRLKALIKINQLPKAILSFLSLIRKDKRLRWGGDFLTPDVVHFDDETNRKEPKLYKQILKLINPKK